MYSFKITAALSLAALARAFTIPSGTPDGVYAISTGEDGTTVHTKISSPSNIKYDLASVAPRALEPRDQGIYCGCGFNLDPSNCDAAVADLKTQLPGAHIYEGTSYYSIRGNVVAFVCVPYTDPGVWTDISPDQYGQALATITAHCGRYIAGAMFTGYSIEYVGYAQWYDGYDFCKHATDSSSTHC
ncbi:hypothetical protein J3E69DRAFT_378303 [Trichoderma sp. SZMC 28015]